MLESTRFLELDCIRLQNESISLLVTRSVGPRIIALQYRGGENLFAQLPEAQLDCPGHRPLILWGGHRLWHAPEVRRRTYLPDDDPVTIAEIEGGLLVTQPTEQATGIQKSIEVRLPDESATVVVDHILTNQGLWPVECAPWAITQLRPGGVAILPQPTAPADPDGLLHNRQIALWTYTDINDPNLSLGNRYIFVSAAMEAGALKIGFPNPKGWLGYHIDKILFVKKAAYQRDAFYYDGGSSSECYCNPETIELETLGPRVRIGPGQSVNHQEVWQVFGDSQFSPTEESADELAARLKLSDDEHS
jgi:hypothetical protein